MNDFPCFCGHPRQWHERLMPHDDIDYCMRCGNVVGLTPKESGAYHDFEPDNLRFLEIKDAQKEIQNSSL